MKEKIKTLILYPESPFRLALILSLPLIIVLLLLILNMLKWEKKSLEDIQIANMKEFAVAFFNHIISTNIWSQSHGGIYVEVTQHPGKQQGQKSFAVMGKDFIKIDPNTVTKQIAQLLQERSVYRFHVTSLNPTSFEGQPDKWEAKALHEFGQGAIQASDVLEINNKRFFRYMAPLTIDEQCLKCHQRWGYNVSDIRGGLSIDIPLETTDRLFAAQVKRSAISFATFGIFTLFTIILLTWFFSKRISDAFREKIRQQEILKKLNDQLSFLSAKDKEILSSIVDGIAIINEDGTIENINSAFKQFTNVQLQDIKGKRVSDFENKTMLKEIFTSTSPGEIRLDNKVFVLTEVPVVKDDRLLCTLRIMHDATNEKLSAAIELAGAAAHEVRQPLAILLSMMDLVREKLEKGEDVSDEVAIFEEQCKRIDNIISRMLNITRYQTKKYTEETQIFDL